MTAIDAPFGWPTTFRSLGCILRQDRRLARSAGSAVRPRRDATACDRPCRPQRDEADAIERLDGQIGVVAMRCARLLAAHREAAGTTPDRSGLGRVVEVYPAAALVQWGISKQSGVVDPGTYKGKTPAARAKRTKIIKAIATDAPWLEMHETVSVVYIDSDNCLDAMICALIGRACELDQVLPVTDIHSARVEGWIRLPTKDRSPTWGADRDLSLPDAYRSGIV